MNGMINKRHGSYPARHYSSRGVTLVETLVVMGIVAILMAIGIPSYKYVTNANRISAEINGLLGDLQFARSEAIKQGRTVSVCVSTDQSSCSTASPDLNWHKGWIVYSDMNGNGAIDAPGEVLRAQKSFTPVYSDADAVYRKVVEFDVGVAEPQIAAPPHTDNVVGISHFAGKAIQHAFIGSCANGSITDLRDAASILRGRKIHPRVRLVVTPATQEIASSAAREGLMEVFSDAGAMVTPAGCGVCAAGVILPMAAGEVSINTGTVNEPGRLGSKQVEIYLASPLSVAASAVKATGQLITIRNSTSSISRSTNPDRKFRIGDRGQDTTHPSCGLETRVEVLRSLASSSCRLL